MNDLNPIDPTISQLNETALVNILLYGDLKKSTSQNSQILQSTNIYIYIYIYIYAAKRFDESLFKRCDLYARFVLSIILVQLCLDMLCANEIYFFYVKLS